METIGMAEHLMRPEMEKRPKERIKNELDAAEKAYNKFLEVEVEIEANLSESDLKTLDEVADNVWQNENLSKEEKKEEIDKRIEANKENPEMGGIIGLFTVGFDLQQSYKELKNEYAPYVKRELAAEAKKLTEIIDFEKVVTVVDESLKNGKDIFYVVFDDLAQVWKLSQEEKYGPEGSDYVWMEERKKEVEQQKKEWQEKGWLRDEGEKREKNKENKDEIKERIGRIIEEGEEYGRLKWKYNTEMDAFKEERFLRYLEVNVTDEEDENLAPGLVEAVGSYVKKVETNRKLEGKMKMNSEEKKEFCQKMIERGQKDFGEIKYSGFGKKENSQILQHYLYNNLPMGFFSGVDVISKGKEAPEKISEDECTLGRFVIKRDKKGNFKSGKVELYVPENDEDFLDTVSHEIGHGVLFFLSLEEYQKWEETVDSDPASITWYVNKSKKVNEETGKKEDFCETLMSFASNPMKLKKMSEVRFNYMKDLFESRTEDGFKENFRHNLELAEKLE